METEKKEKKCCKVWLIVTLVLALYSTILTSYIGLKLGVFDLNSPINKQPLIQRTISKSFAKKMTYAKAQKSDKPMVVLFYADWCKFCKMLAPNFAKAIKSKDFKENFVAAYVNCDAPENQDLVNEYGIHSFPTIYFVPKHGAKQQLDVSVFHEKNAAEILKSMLIK